ncbi:DUF6368 family protein [Phytomonospora sp. NPDC050363]
MPWTVTYGGGFVVHVGDAAFLEAWLAQPGFHLVK